MNFKNLVKKTKPAEILVLVIFILYLVLPVTTPSKLSPFIESPLGLLLLLCIAIGLFVYSHPVLGVLFIFVAYTLLRRSASVRNSSHYVRHTKETSEKLSDAQKQVTEATPPHEEPRTVGVKVNEDVTLEEQIVQERAPIGRSDPVQFLQSSYKPVSTNVDGSTSF
jgi:predicted neutral ceramidase superfamily lipid hydrolase